MTNNEPEMSDGNVVLAAALLVESHGVSAARTEEWCDVAMKRTGDPDD